MDLTRRQFVQVTGAAAAGIAFSGQGADLKPVEARAREIKTQGAKESTTVCCYCGVGCGAIVHTRQKDGRIINIEGDPDHVINRGALCSKGAALSQLAESPARLTQPLYRAPGAKGWKSVSWEWAIDTIARRVKTTRDANFLTTNAQGQTVRRVEAIASVGSAALDNEECWIYQALLRSLGLVYIEHQARI